MDFSFEPLAVWPVLDLLKPFWYSSRHYAKDAITTNWPKK
jgi:hypothetical protein